MGICALCSFHLPVSFIALYSNTMTAGFRENQMLLSTWTHHKKPTRGHKRHLKATRRRRDVFLFFYWCFLTCRWTSFYNIVRSLPYDVKVLWRDCCEIKQLNLEDGFYSQSAYWKLTANKCLFSNGFFSVWRRGNRRKAGVVSYLSFY